MEITKDRRFTLLLRRYFRKNDILKFYSQCSNSAMACTAEDLSVHYPIRLAMGELMFCCPTIASQIQITAMCNVRVGRKIEIEI